MQESLCTLELSAERFLLRTRIQTAEKSENNGRRIKCIKDKEKKTRTRADSRLFNLSANVRRLRRRDFQGDLLVSPGPTSWGTMQRQFNFVPDLRAWCIQMGSRAQAKCISQRSRAWVVGAREDKASTTLKPFAEQYRTSGPETVRPQCFPRIAVTPSPSHTYAYVRFTTPSLMAFPHGAQVLAPSRNAISN